MMRKMTRRRIKEKRVVKGHAVARETVTAEDESDDRLARDPVLRGQEGVVQGLVPPRGTGRGAHHAQEADRGIVLQSQEGGHGDLVPEAVQGPVPVLETATEKKAGEGSRGVGHVNAEEKDPVQDQKKEGGATVPAPVTATGDFSSWCCLLQLTFWSGNRLTVVGY